MAVLAEVRDRLRRPSGLVEQTRWLFFLTVPAPLVVKLIWPIAAAAPLDALVLLGGSVCLVAIWSYQYFTRSSPLLIDLGQAAAVSVVAVFCPAPETVLAFVFASLWFRALYGSTVDVLRSCALLALGLAVAALLSYRGVESIAGVLTTLPAMFVTGGVARYLALSLFARERAQLRDAALVRLGDSLIGLTDRMAIQLRAADCAAAICAATPGLRSLVAVDTGDGHRVFDRVGEFRDVLPSLPPGTLPTGASDGTVQTVVDADLLTAAAGIRGEWLAVPLADKPGGWIVLGAPGRVPAEAVVAIQSMTNQVALAMRTSDAHHDLATLAHVDALTGLANRAAFNAALERSLSLRDVDRPPALMFVDLDDFKVVNDGLGHAAGDELLGVVAARLRNALRPGDHCARLGGDEFAVLLPRLDGTTDAEVVRIAQRIVEVIAAPTSLTGGPAQVGASLGVAFGTAAVSGEQLMQQADIAMYAAKAKGKNRMQVFDPGLLREDGHAVFEAELAAATGAGQLEVHYQPIVAVEDGHCVAVEALVRWRHPTRGLLAPGDFIAEAERTGAIVDIGAYVLRRACTDAARWRRTHEELAVHVNVSAAQLTAKGFPDLVRACLVDFGMPPKRLVLEITESMVLDSHLIRAALDDLIALGVELAIDDFGTGYSALTTLRTLPLSVVKIDKSFIVGTPVQAEDAAVVQAIVQMAGRLGLRIVAEGVERVDQQDFLESIGADAAQGFLHLRPSAATEFENWLDRNAAARAGDGAGTVTLLRAPRTSPGP